MTAKKSTPLTIEVLGFNFVFQRTELMLKLRELTLERFSGMNYELDRMSKDATERTVNCQILLAYLEEELVAWALVSKENTDFCFMRANYGFSAANGTLFQVFVNPDYRRQGIATKLHERALQLAKDDDLYVCPWDFTSTEFYNKRLTTNTKWL